MVFKMIDLHMHTTYSDGTDDLKTVLKKAYITNTESDIHSKNNGINV